MYPEVKIWKLYKRVESDVRNPGENCINLQWPAHISTSPLSAFPIVHDRPSSAFVALKGGGVMNYDATVVSGV